MDTARTVLYRDGEEFATEHDILSTASFELPPEGARYELVTTAGRSGQGFPVSREITSSFTFTSGAGSGGPGELVQLPASVIRFAPGLDLDSTAPAGKKSFRVPFSVQGTAEAHPSTVKISYSTDGGATWKKAPVAEGSVKIDNPKAGGSVSLRAEIMDGHGNKAVQTITDAYLTR